MKAHSIAVAVSLAVAACASQDLTAEGPDSEEMQEGDVEVKQAIAEMVKKDPGIQKFIDGAYGYAAFPSVGKGGLIVGGSSGDGFVYEQGALIGKSELTKVTVGAQAGGESYAEIIFFEDKTALDAFTRGDFKLGADVNAVVAEAGASAKAGYEKGMAIFVMTKTGVMAEASVGGQKFNFERVGQ